MTDAAAFRATVHSLRTVPSRKIVQLVLELPIEELSRVAQIAEHGSWVAVARLNPPAIAAASRGGQEGESVGTGGYTGTADPPPIKSKPLNPLAQKAGIMCHDPVFQKFMKAGDTIECTEMVRTHCGVTSRSWIKDGTPAGVAWRDLVERFEGWKAVEKCWAP